jgi:hypothetical protein
MNSNFQVFHLFFRVDFPFYKIQRIFEIKQEFFLDAVPFGDTQD